MNADAKRSKGLVLTTGTALLSLLLPALAGGNAPPRDEWRALLELPSGTRVRVQITRSTQTVELERSAASGSLRRLRSKTFSGRLVSVENEGIVLAPDEWEFETWQIAKNQIRSVARLRQERENWDGALLGAAIGGAAVGVFAAATGDLRFEVLVPIGAGVGFLAGALVDNAEPDESAEIIYRAGAS